MENVWFGFIVCSSKKEGEFDKLDKHLINWKQELYSCIILLQGYARLIGEIGFAVSLLFCSSLSDCCDCR